MKTTLHYTERMTLCIHALGVTVTMDLDPKPLDSALAYVEHIFNDNTMFRSECVDDVHIINSNTGELIAKCEPDFKPSAFDDDWNYEDHDPDYDYDC